MAATLKEGLSFSSFDELEKALNQHVEQEQVPYIIMSTFTTRAHNAKFEKKLPDCLKYAHVTYACKHAGKRRSTSKGLRPDQSTFKMGCPARVTVRANPVSNKLVVTKITKEHNHDISYW